MPTLPVLAEAPLTNSKFDKGGNGVHKWPQGVGEPIGVISIGGRPQLVQAYPQKAGAIFHTWNRRCLHP